MQRSAVFVTSCLLLVAGRAFASGEAALANPTDPTVAPEIAPPETQQDPSIDERPAFGPMLALLGASEQPAEASVPAARAETATAADEAAVAADEAPVVETEAADETPVQAAMATDRSGTEALPLGRPAESQLLVRAAETESNKVTDGWFVRTALALTAVIGLILATRFALQWIEARTTGGAVMTSSGKVRAPSGLVEVLARYPVSRGTKLLLLKINSRILLVSQTSSGLSTLSEISDPDEVASILIKSRDEDGESAASRFMEVLREMENDPSVAPERIDVRSPRKALRERLAENDEAEPPTPLDGASALRNRLSHLGDLSA